MGQEEVALGSATTALPSIIEAAMRGDGAGVAACLQRGDDVNATDADGCTALMHAAARGDAAIVQTLLNAGADPHRYTHHDVSARALAIASGAHDVVALFPYEARSGVRWGTDPGALTPSDDAATYVARNGYLRLVAPAVKTVRLLVVIMLGLTLMLVLAVASSGWRAAFSDPGPLMMLFFLCGMLILVPKKYLQVQRAQTSGSVCCVVTSDSLFVRSLSGGQCEVPWSSVLAVRLGPIPPLRIVTRKRVWSFGAYGNRASRMAPRTGVVRENFDTPLKTLYLTLMAPPVETTPGKHSELMMRALLAQDGDRWEFLIPSLVFADRALVTDIARRVRGADVEIADNVRAWLPASRT